MMGKIPWKLILSMCLKIVLIYFICSIIPTSETAASKRIGSTDEKYHRSPNESHLPQMELDDATAKSHNSRDEDDGSYIVLTPLLSEMHVNANKTPFLCFNTTFNQTRFQPTAFKNFFTIIMLHINNRTHPSSEITMCKPLVKDEIVVEYAPACSFIMSSFICCTFFLFSVGDCITSLPIFVVLFLASNVFIYFLICLILTGSLSGTVMYFLPVHVNFLFLLIMGWATIPSCKVVFGMEKSRKIWRITTSNIIEVGYTFYVFHVIDVLLCIFLTTYIVDSRSYIVHTSDNSLESMYFQMLADYGFDIMVQYTILMMLVTACTVMVVVVAVISIYTREEEQGGKMKDPTVQHTKYLYYFLFAVVLWVYGFVAVTVPDYPHFWRLYFFVAMALPTFFLIDVIMNAKVRPSFLIERSGNSEETYRIRVKDV